MPRDLDATFLAGLGAKSIRDIAMLITFFHADVGPDTLYFRLRGRSINWGPTPAPPLYISNKGAYSAAIETIEQEAPSIKLQLQDRDKFWRGLINTQRINLNHAKVTTAFVRTSIDPADKATSDKSRIIDFWTVSGYELGTSSVSFNLQLPFDALDAKLPFHTLGGSRCRHTQYEGACNTEVVGKPCNNELEGCMKNYAGSPDDPLQFSTWILFDNAL